MLAVDAANDGRRRDPSHERDGGVAGARQVRRQRASNGVHDLLLFVCPLRLPRPRWPGLTGGRRRRIATPLAPPAIIVHGWLPRCAFFFYSSPSSSGAAARRNDGELQRGDLNLGGGFAASRQRRERS